MMMVVCVCVLKFIFMAAAVTKMSNKQDENSVISSKRTYMHTHICVHGQKQGLHSCMCTRTKTIASLTSVYTDGSRGFTHICVHGRKQRLHSHLCTDRSKSLPSLGWHPCARYKLHASDSIQTTAVCRHPGSRMKGMCF